MRKKKHDKSSNCVTFVEDPFGIPILEISDAQNSPEPQPHFDEGLPEVPEDVPESPETVEERFEKIAQALAEQTETEPIADSTSKGILEAQIAEDQALDESLTSNQDLDTIDPVTVSPMELRLDAEETQSCIEALLYISDKPLSLKRLSEILGSPFSMEYIQTAIVALKERYQAVHHGFEVVEIAGGYQFRTKPGRADLAKKLVKVQTQRLSTGAMETLAVIAYKQPLMKEEIDKVRGVDSSYFIRGLLHKKLIKITGRSELPGRPILYTTTDEFLELFGLNNLHSLPSLRELEQMVPGSQTANPEDEDPRIRDLRKMVGAMKADRTGALHYDPEEDEKILKEIRDRVTSISTSTPYLDELKAAEDPAQKQRELDTQKPKNDENKL